MPIRSDIVLGWAERIEALILQKEPRGTAALILSKRAE